MRPRLSWLETFLAIAETGSLTQAGNRVARSQSAVSLHLRQLEDVLGARLFERDTRHVALTVAGERLLPLARQALESVDAAACALQAGSRRVVRVGVPEEYADRLVPAIVDTAGRRDPLLEFEIECAASAELERRQRQGRLDLALALADEIDGRGRPVCAEPVVWLEAPGRKLSRCRPLPVALFDQACSWRQKALAALEAAAIDYNVVFTSSSVAGVRAGIRAGYAIGALARSTAGPDLELLAGSDIPRLPAAELVMLGADAAGDAAPLIERVRATLAS